mmetsp:Transcript_40059/g.45581  ORF Transcript_40059/g.45581 Transcript_40059/m.45581 type:complete len:375 (-) Transcript_40059:149-1273(-)|eukprot:CAMPEP_0194141260 /NCGR_PEP_ID=MMETSP0152-20130528/10688_1 /TAXON_ID=1049557 /ORGANISM="Thalassiothrix antarctica, Strain L6-D1" /LENGTH=374 /DNA_ID=CAMNT_0038839813 /DNA_START=105 /DNA_END=1229 /DNA_ORIENTATION=-
MRVFENKERHGYTVLYDSESHWLVMGQMWGSMWPKVFPYCAVNVLIMIVLNIINKITPDSIAIGISETNLSLLTLVVAFLIVSRVKLAYARYLQAISGLMVMYREASELAQKLVVFTADHTDETASAWRNEVAYQTCILLRAAMGVIDYEEHNVNVWELKEFDDEERAEIKKYVYLDIDSLNSTSYGITDNNRTSSVRWSHQDAMRSQDEENARVPVRLSNKLRRFICSGRKALVQGPLLSDFQERQLLGAVDGMMSGYFDIRSFKTAPFPFPLVQMARTFLFLYVYMVPFALLTDQGCGIIADCITIFVMTFGFIGLEFVSIELTEPFGEDENDFDNLGMAYTIFEDIKCTVLDIDGHEWTQKLHARLNPPHS